MARKLSTGWTAPSAVVIAVSASPLATLPAASVPPTPPSMVTEAGTRHPRYSRAATCEVDCEDCICAWLALSTCSWVAVGG